MKLLPIKKFCIRRNKIVGVLEGVNFKILTTIPEFNPLPLLYQFAEMCLGYVFIDELQMQELSFISDTKMAADLAGKNAQQYFPTHYCQKRQNAIEIGSAKLERKEMQLSMKISRSRNNNLNTNRFIDHY